MTADISTALVVAAEAKLTRYSAASKAMAEYVRVDEVKHVRDQMVAMQVYARQAKNTEFFDRATEIRMRAERRTGELLIEMAKTGARLKTGPKPGTGIKEDAEPRAKVRRKEPTNAVTLSELGITKEQSSDWQKLAKQPEKDFERAIVEAKGLPTRKPREPDDDDDAPTREEINDANTTARSRIFLRFAADTLRKLEQGAGLKNSKRGEIGPEIKKALNDLVRACTKLRDDVLNRKE